MADLGHARPGRPTAFEWAALALILLVAAALRLSHPGVGYLNMHAARDCFRTLDLIQGGPFHATGPEFFYGGRTPGWFYYLYLSVPLSVSPSPLSINVWIGILSLVTGALWHVVCPRHVGVGTSLVATALFAVSPISIAMARYMWNPAHLPLFSVLFLLFLLRWRTDGRRWALGAALVVWGLAFQIHFTAYVYLVALLAMRPWRRDRRSGWFPVAIALLTLVLFLWPFVANEIATRGGNTAAVAAATHGDNPILATRLNPTAIPQALEHLQFDLREATVPTRHAHFTHFLTALEQSHPRWLAFADGVHWFTWLQVILFGVGMVALTAAGLGRPRALAERLRGLFVRPDTAPTLALIVWVWLGVPMLTLLFLGTHGVGARAVPARYFIIWYPVQYLVIALGLRALAQLATRREGPAWRWRLGPLPAALVTALVLAQATVAMLFLRVSAETGVTFHFAANPELPLHTVGDKMRIAEILVTERGLNLNAFRERFTTDLALSQLTEQFIDYEMRAQPRFTVQPDPPPDLRFHLMSHERPFPIPPASAEVVHTDEVGALRAVTYRVTDPALIIPSQAVENPYIW